MSSYASSLNKNQLASTTSLSDKDDKTWDRGKSLLKDLPDHITHLEKLEKVFFSTEKSYVEKAAEGSLESFLLDREKGK